MQLEDLSETPIHLIEQAMDATRLLETLADLELRKKLTVIRADLRSEWMHRKSFSHERQYPAEAAC